MESHRKWTAIHFAPNFLGPTLCLCNVVLQVTTHFRIPTRIVTILLRFNYLNFFELDLQKIVDELGIELGSSQKVNGEKFSRQKIYFPPTCARFWLVVTKGWTNQKSWRRSMHAKKLQGLTKKLLMLDTCAQSEKWFYAGWGGSSGRHLKLYVRRAGVVTPLPVMQVFGWQPSFRIWWGRCWADWIAIHDRDRTEIR